MTTLADIQNNVSVAPSSGVATIDALLNSGNGWFYLTPSVGNTLYYSFSITEGTNPGTSALTAFTDSQKSAARQVMSYAAGVTGIQFTEITSGTSADLHFAAKNVASASASGICEIQSGYSYNSSNTIITYTQDAYIYLDNVEYLSSNQTPTSGTTGYQVLLHEVGHALGLKHPFESDSATSGVLAESLDNTNNTVMSYTWAGENKTTFQAYDLAALNFIYGGDGLGGTNLTLGTSGTSAAIITGTVGNDKLAGTADNEEIDGYAGNDVLVGAAGNDTLDGGEGNDKLTGSAGDDSLIGGEGNDTLTDADGNDVLVGGAGNDKLAGGAGNDTLTGGGGNDTLTGNTGADRFVFNGLVTGEIDTIKDFKLSEGDKLVLDKSVFTSLAAGIAAGNVVIAATATAAAADDFLLLSTKGGKLYYDADGSGTGAAIQIAGIKGSFSGIDYTSFVVE